MKVGYFVNEYPAVSHTFIRREIAALEEHGLDIHRYALKSHRRQLVDSRDIAEFKRTRLVQSAGIAELLISLLAVIVGRPLACLSAFGLGLRMARRSRKGLLRHLAYVLEAMILARWLRRDGVDRLHAHFGTNSAAIAMLAAQIAGIPYSFTVHGPDEYDDAPYLSLDLKARLASFVVCVSWYGRSQLMRVIPGSDWPKLVVIRCGLGEEYFGAPPAPSSSAASFACIGRLAPQKGQHVLIEALKVLQERNIACHVTLVGDGPMRAELEAAVQEAGLQELITITGWASGEQVREHLRQCRFMVLPSLAENLPVGIMEAMAMGRPVISTFIAGIPELVIPGRNGWLVPAGNPQALAQAMEQASHTGDATIREMASNCQEIVSRNHRARLEAGRLAALFRNEKIAAHAT